MRIAYAKMKILGSAFDKRAGLHSRKLGVIETLTLLSPLRIGPKDRLSTNFSTILYSIAERSALLAKYESLHIPFDGSAWRNIAKAQHYDTTELRAVTWNEKSSEHGR